MIIVNELVRAVGKTACRRLEQDDCAIAQDMFTMMAVAFEEECAPLPADYLRTLMPRADIWIIAAEEDDMVVGGLRPVPGR